MELGRNPRTKFSRKSIDSPNPALLGGFPNPVQNFRMEPSKAIEILAAEYEEPATGERGDDMPVDAAFKDRHLAKKLTRPETYFA
jgi:hypothetical protein